MKKSLITILTIVSVPFLIFVGWMNLTPGHFQLGPCGCSVSYYDANAKLESGELIPCPLAICQPNTPTIIMNVFLRGFSFLDFNK